jgi:hypothetical protein
METPFKTAPASICYACDEPATTKVHAPPLSFFPEGHRVNLVTVPSCELHNNAESMDAEYTRNVISILLDVNPVGELQFLEKGVRSREHAPAQLHTTFSDIRPVKVAGQEVGADTIDVNRVKNVMSACLTAMHFRETGEKVPTWEVVLPNLGFSAATLKEVRLWREAISAFWLIPCHARSMDSSVVFEYAVGKIEAGRVYRMRFYGGFNVFGARGQFVV